ncbi:hypothetical protein E8E12_000920 [Didymella heteroderae]|uniref:Uncharacterized protein n=1 Tax=Didymella heteroderae TaxID=1769908 RepID=A0A9P4WH27_9PLEO|nr:hypothetical protein E8E12_000920 [Didymella heteroderae]
MSLKQLTAMFPRTIKMIKMQLSIPSIPISLASIKARLIPFTILEVNLDPAQVHRVNKGNGVTAAAKARGKRESRGDPVIPWAKLYLKLHPGMTEIPTPYTDEHEWLSPAVLTLCLQQASRSFLGRQTQRTTVTAPLWREPSLSYDQSTYNAFLDVMLQEAGGGDTYTNTDPNVVFQALNPADDRVAYIDQLNYARNQYLGLLFHAPRHLSAQELRDVTSVLGQVASAAHTYHAAFTTPAALSVNTHASTDEMDHVFSDLALSPQTDRTTAPDINALDSSGNLAIDAGLSVL